MEGYKPKLVRDEEYEWLLKMKATIEEDDVTGKTQLCFVPHIPISLLNDFKEKIVNVYFEGYLDKAFCSLMQEALDKQKALIKLKEAEEKKP